MVFVLLILLYALLTYSSKLPFISFSTRYSNVSICANDVHDICHTFARVLETFTNVLQTFLGLKSDIIYTHLINDMEVPLYRELNQ